MLLMRRSRPNGAVIRPRLAGGTARDPAPRGSAAPGLSGARKRRRPARNCRQTQPARIEVLPLPLGRRRARMRRFPTRPHPACTVRRRPMASKSSAVSRRGVLKAAGAAAGAVAVTGGSALLGGREAQQGAPAILTNTQAGRRFRAYVKFGKDAPTVVEVRARALAQREILVRVDAATPCYKDGSDTLMPSAFAPRQASIIGHGGV